MKRLSRDQILLIQKLYTHGYSENKIVKITHFSKSTISKYLRSKKFEIIKGVNKLKSYERIHEVNRKPYKQLTPTSIAPSHVNYVQNPVNNVPKASSVSSPTPNATTVKNQSTSNLPTVSTTPKVPENTDNTKSTTWDLIKSYLKKTIKRWLKNISDDIDLKLHHNYEDRP